MHVHAIQTGEVQIKSRHVDSRFGPRPARVADVLADRELGAPAADPLLRDRASERRAHRRSTALLRELCGRRRVVVAPSHDPETPRRLAAG